MALAQKRVLQLIKPRVSHHQSDGPFPSVGQRSPDSSAAHPRTTDSMEDVDFRGYSNFLPLILRHFIMLQAAILLFGLTEVSVASYLANNTIWLIILIL